MRLNSLGMYEEICVAGLHEDFNKTDMIYETIEYFPEKPVKPYGCNGEINLHQAIYPHSVRQAVKDGYFKLGFSTSSEQSSIGVYESYLTINQGERFVIPAFISISLNVLY